MLVLKFTFFSFILGTSHAFGFEFKGFKLLYNIISRDITDSPKITNETISTTTKETILYKGTTQFSFIDHISHRDRYFCYANNSNFLYLDDYDSIKSTLQMKCLPKLGNGTIQIITSLKEAITVLAPVGNVTKRTNEGKCVAMLFYTKSCIICTLVSPHITALSRFFPDIQFAAIDAFKFHNFNTEYGVISLPTLMLFHQGRPIVKYNITTRDHVQTYANFVYKHTGIQPIPYKVYVHTSDLIGPLITLEEEETDIYLILAWIFILVCCVYYFTKSMLCKQLIEMIVRNWRESEAQHEQNS